MGMTIDEAIKYYLNKNIVLTEEEALANTIALNTMRKYQKIQKILNNASYVENGTVYSYTYDEDSRIKHIREVIEDGKID